LLLLVLLLCLSLALACEAAFAVKQTFGCCAGPKGVSTKAKQLEQEQGLSLKAKAASQGATT
jgi:hypothetical protein